MLNRITTGLLLAAIAVMSSGPVLADGGRYYEVTITNITKGEIFTPVLVATHQRGVRLFELGQPASPELEALAESGNTQPLTDALLASGKALDVVTSGGVLPPGQSVTLKVKSNGKHAYLSVASMLVPTNDAFVAVTGIRLSKKHRSLTTPAYDAGTEDNDELCVSIPGPPFICAGEGVSANGGEGYVYVHAGIQGNGDLVPASHDWRNPVARITIHRVND